jgi:hypothetical protein
MCFVLRKEVVLFQVQNVLELLDKWEEETNTRSNLLTFLNWGMSTIEPTGKLWKCCTSTLALKT